MHLVLTVRNYSIALYKYVILFQFDSTFNQYPFCGTFTDMEMFTNFLVWSVK